ncbi:MAG: hypothetical protein MUP47_05525 [Phycisphaerae bacterium]|nr:hypothetical protein [Phycisphaerae bacterium]
MSPGRILRWFKQGNTPLAVLFAAALASVYLLSLRHGPASAMAQEKAEDGQVETALAQWQARTEVAKRTAGTAADLVTTFYYETQQRQIPPERLAGNPFEFKPLSSAPAVPLASAAEPEPPGGDPSGTIDALSALKELRLQSVLAGPHGATAMISNNILTEGQVIRGWTIIKIEPESATLKWQDQTVELKMH